MLALGLLLLVGSQEPSAAGRAAELGRALGLELRSGRELVLDGAALAERARAAGVPLTAVERARVLAAEAVDASGGARETRLASVPLADAQRADGPGACLVLAVDANGTLLGAALIGEPDLELDPDARWSAFLAQLGKPRPLPLGLGATPDPPAALERALAALPDVDRERARALVEQRHAMRANLVFLSAVQGRLRGSLDAYDAAEARRQERALADLADLAPRLAPVAGVSAEDYAALARSGADAFGELARRREAGPLAAADVGPLLRRAGEACAACHETPGLQAGVRAERAALGLPEAPLLVGYDLTAAPGDDGRRSRAVADALRAALVLLAADG